MLTRRVPAAAFVGAALIAAGWWIGARQTGSWTPQPSRDPVVTVLDVPSPPWSPDPTALVPELGPAGLTLGGDLDPAAQVTCAVEPPIAASSVEILDDALPDVPEVARIADGLLVIPAPRPEGSGVLKVPGYLPIRFAWRDGRCTSEPVRLEVGGAAVVGVVRDAEGKGLAGVTVTGCGGSAVTDRDGSYYLEGVPDQPCTVQASRQDGAIAVTGPEVSLTPSASGDTVVELVLASDPSAGVGLIVEEDLHGVWVRTVLADSPAGEAGIRPGDQVLTVDGVPAEDVLEPGSAELSPGEPGSTVTLGLHTSAGPRTVVVERAEL